MSMWLVRSSSRGLHECINMSTVHMWPVSTLHAEDLADWQATLDQAVTLVEGNLAMKKSALDHSWVQQCLRLDLRQQDVHLAFFLQACMQ